MPGVVDGIVRKGRGIGRIAPSGDGKRERHAVLPEHEVGRLPLAVVGRDFRRRGDLDPGDVVGGETMPRHQAAEKLDGRLRRDVARIGLDAEPARLEERSEPRGEQGRIGARAEARQHAEFALQDGARPVIACGGEQGGEDPALRRAPEMQPLDHAALSAAREREKPAGAGPGDAERVGELVGRQCEQAAARDCGAERPDDAGGVETLELRRVQRRRADAEARLTARDDRRDQVAASTRPRLRHGEGGQRDGGARMRAGAGLAQAVELEGMRECAERQRRLAGIEPPGEAGHGARA